MLTDTQKKQRAVDFINDIRYMDPAELNALIVAEAGEELAQFFLNYSANLIAKEPSRVLETCSSLLLMGYLIGHRVPASRAPEFAVDFGCSPTQPGGEA